jgi:hypothetical protein
MTDVLDMGAGRPPLEITGTIDIESSDWTNFSLGVCYRDGYAKHFWGRPPRGDEEPLPGPLRDPNDADAAGEGLDAMIDYLRTIGGTWWGHGLGIYDGLAILERARVRGIPCQIDRAAHRVTRIVMGKLTLRDSYALWPVPIDDICGALGRKVPKLPWPCICGRDCGAYCRIAEKAAEGDEELLDYCIADCRDLFDGLHLLRDFTQKHRISLRGTLGQTAWHTARSEIGVPESDMPWHLWRSARKADKGGRGAIVRPFVKDRIVSHHDICNAYPGQLAKAELPVGNVRELGGDQARLALGNCRPGLYTLTVHVPEDLFLPPLPFSHGGSVWFPVGEFSGTWTLPELACAFERGVSILKVHSALIWEATAPIFGGLVRRWYDIRKAAGRKTPLGQWTGRCAKALTGVFAMKPDRQRVTMHPESIKVCLRVGPCRNGCNGRCGAYEQLDLDGQIWGIPYQRLGGSSYPQWSAYLRAATRVQWLEQAERYGEDLCFGNTDSLWTIGRRAPEPLGDGLGEWEFQGAWYGLEVRSLTCYAMREIPSGMVFTIDGERALNQGKYEPIPGKLHVRGIPHATEEDWKRGAGVIDRGVVTFGRAMKTTRGLFSKKKRTWSLPESEGRQIWGDRKMSSGGFTVPLHAMEVRELVELARRKRERRFEEPAESKSRGRRARAR